MLWDLCIEVKCNKWVVNLTSLIHGFQGSQSSSSSWLCLYSDEAKTHCNRGPANVLTCYSGLPIGSSPYFVLLLSSDYYLPNRKRGIAAYVSPLTSSTQTPEGAWRICTWNHSRSESLREQTLRWEGFTAGREIMAAIEECSIFKCSFHNYIDYNSKWISVKNFTLLCAMKTMKTPVLSTYTVSIGFHSLILLSQFNTIKWSSLLFW